MNTFRDASVLKTARVELILHGQTLAQEKFSEVFLHFAINSFYDNVIKHFL